MPCSCSCNCFGMSTEELWIFKKPCVVITGTWAVGTVQNNLWEETTAFAVVTVVVLESREVEVVLVLVLVRLFCIESDLSLGPLELWGVNMRSGCLDTGVN